VRGWWPHGHPPALGAIAPEGTLDRHGQGRARPSTSVGAFVAPLLREVAGQGGLIWDGAPSHRRRALQEGWGPGAAQRLPLERLPAYAPALNPGEGLWAQLKGVERRHRCRFNIPHLRHELRDALNQGRRQPRRSESFFRGAQL
jgi:transposase